MSTDSALPVNTANKAVNIKIVTLTGKSIPIAASLDDSVDDLKNRIELAEGIPPEFQRLIFAGRELTMQMPPISAYNIVEGSSVHLVLRRNQPVESQPVTDEAYARRLQQQQEMARVDPNSYPPAPNAPGPIPMVPAMMIMRGQDGDDIIVNIGQQRGVPPADQAEMALTYQMSRAVRMFAIVDIIFLVVWSFNYYMLGIGVVLTVCGYFGARNYRPALVFSYLMYLLLSIGIRIYWITLTTNSLLFCIVIGFGVAIEAYICRIVFLFFQRTRQVTEAQRITLMMEFDGRPVVLD